jgi:hypothetical protein
VTSVQAPGEAGNTRDYRARPLAPLVHLYMESVLRRALPSSALVAPALRTLYSVDRSTLRKRFCEEAKSETLTAWSQYRWTYLEFGAECHHADFVSTYDGFACSLNRLIRTQLWHTVCK